MQPSDSASGDCSVFPADSLDRGAVAVAVRSDLCVRQRDQRLQLQQPDSQLLHIVPTLGQWTEINYTQIQRGIPH